MTTKRDYYEVLGINRDASPDEIRRAYRGLARKFHPDVNKEPDAETKFKEINEANAVLSDPDKRAVYDRFGHNGPSGGGGFSGDPFGGEDPFSTIFESFFGGGGRQQRGPQRGADLKYTLRLSFEEAVFGAEKEIEYRRLESCGSCAGSGAQAGTDPVKCTRCNGSGEVRQRSAIFNMMTVTTCDVCRGEGTVIAIPCRDCRGEGRIRQSHKLTAKVPAGIDGQAQLRLNGEGEAGPRGGPYGNLYVVFDIQPHQFFRREDNDIVLELPINVAQAALGAEIQVPTLEGIETVRINPGMQSGTSFRLRAKGVPYLRGSGRGDQVVIARVMTPEKLTEQQRLLFEALAATFDSKSGTTGKDGANKQSDNEGLLEQIKNALGL